MTTWSQSPSRSSWGRQRLDPVLSSATAWPGLVALSSGYRLISWSYRARPAGPADRGEAVAVARTDRVLLDEPRRLMPAR